MRPRDIEKVLNQYQKIENGKKVRIYVSEIFNIRDYAIDDYRKAGGTMNTGFYIL